MLKPKPKLQPKPKVEPEWLLRLRSPHRHVVIKNCYFETPAWTFHWPANERPHVVTP